MADGIQDERRERLAAALRANLRRRKRPVGADAATGVGGDAVDPGEGSARVAVDDQRH